MHMARWEEYWYLDGFRWVNEHHDEVRVAREPVGDRYHVRFKPARSTVLTTVPNGRKESFEAAVSYATDVVMGDDRINRISDHGNVTAAADRYERQINVGEYVDVSLLSSEHYG